MTYTKRQEMWVNKPASPSLIDAEVANWWEDGIFQAHVGLDRIVARTVDVHTYGAAGDGVTDDSAAIQAALTAAGGMSGPTSVVTRPGSTYRLTTQVIPPSNVSFGPLRGRSTLKLTSGSTARAILVQDVDNIEIHDLDIDLNKSATTDGGSNSGQQGVYGLYSTTRTGLAVRRVTVRNGWRRGLEVSITSPGSISDVVFEDCTLTAVAESALVVQCIAQTDRTTPSASSRVAIRGCSVSGHGIYGILLTGVSDASVRDCSVNGVGSTGHGICISASTNGTPGSYRYRHVTDIDVVGNHVRGCTGTGKWGIVASVGTKRFAISRNVIAGCAGGITADLEDGTEIGVRVVADGMISGNVVSGTTASHGINARLLEGVTITGNTIRGTALAGIAIANAYAVTASTNTILGAGTDGVAIQGTSAGTGGHRVEGNNIRGQGGTVTSTSSPPVACVVQSS